MLRRLVQFLMPGSCYELTAADIYRMFPPARKTADVREV